MSRSVSTDLQPDFSGGLNASSAEVTLLPNQVTRALNARLTQLGSVRKRAGTRRLTTSALAAGAITGLTEWRLSDGTRYLVSACNGTLYRATHGALPMTFSSISGGTVDAAVRASFVVFRDATGDALYCADGGLLNKVTVSAGPTFTLTPNIASTPAVTDVEVFNQRLWGCGSSSFPQAIFFSALNDGDTLGIGASGGGQINVRTFGQANVIALQSLGTSLLVFHRGGVSRVTGYGQDDTEVLPAAITGDVGTVSPASIVRVGNLAFYVNVRGLFVASAEMVQPVNTPDKPDPLADILPGLTETQLSAVSCVFVPATRELVITVPTIGAYVYHTLLQSWSGPWDGAYVSSSALHFANAGDADNAPIVLKGGSDGYIEWCDAPSMTLDSVAADGTGGSGFSMSVVCRRMFSGDYATMKSYRWAYVLGDLNNSGNATLSWTTGTAGGSSPMTQNSTEVLATEGSDPLVTESGDTLSVTSDSSRMRVPVWGTGYYADLTVQDSSTDSIPTISRVELSGFVLGRR